jgi:hypothetical protein
LFEGLLNIVVLATLIDLSSSRRRMNRRREVSQPGNMKTGVFGRIILRWIFRKWEGILGTRWSWLRIGTGGGRL